jgi:hypothetical protein
MRRYRIVAKVNLGAIAFVSATVAALAPVRAEALVHVRAASPAARLLIDESARYSPTVRDLIDRVDRSDVIVYVQMTASSQVASASTTFVTATEGQRYLRILIHAGTPVWSRAQLLAHELQHVIEIASEPEVASNDGIRSLYERIGHASGKDRYETGAARQIEAKVRAEIVRARK